MFIDSLLDLIGSGANLIHQETAMQCLSVLCDYLVVKDDRTLMEKV